MELVIVFMVFIGFVLYFLPSIVAGKRGHSNVGPIIALNLFLGWTFLGWVIALVWSLSSQSNPSIYRSSTSLELEGGSWSGMSTSRLITSAETLGVTFQINPHGGVSLHYFGNQNPLPVDLNGELRLRKDEVSSFIHDRQATH